MALKRKRSSLLPSPSSSTSSLSPPPYDPTSPTPIRSFPNAVPMDLDHTISAPQWQHNWSEDRDYMSTRTRKRVRDNRPDEDVIHRNTLAKLFSAQRTEPDCPAPAPQETTKPITTQRTTLHSFWTLPAPVTRTFTVSSHAHVAQGYNDQTQCSDCSQSLREEDGMELDTPWMQDESACRLCRRAVCDSCAVGLVDLRRCLRCLS